MQPIKIKLRRPTEEGRLYPRYDQESNVLVAESRVRRPWPFGVDIDGRIIFDIDAEHVLASFEVIARRRLWIVREPFGAPPVPTVKADLEFTQESLQHKSFSLDLEITTNQERTKALIMFGVPKGIPRAVELSENCVALVEEDRLLGFWVGFAVPPTGASQQLRSPSASSSQDLTWDTISDRLVGRVPELQTAYEYELKWEKTPNPHVVFNQMLYPFLVSLLESNGDRDILRRIFAFLEEVANHDVLDIREIARLTVLRKLCHDQGLLTKAQRYMGEATRQMCRDIQAYEGIPALLLERVPELRPAYDSNLQEWGKERPEPHAILGEVLTPFLISLLESNGGEDILRRIFAFLEELANHRDLLVPQVVQTSVLEHLGEERSRLERARTFMGQATRLLSDEMEAYWDRLDK